MIYFPQPAPAVDVTVSYPQSGFGTDWPTGLLDGGNSITATGVGSAWFMAMDRSKYGTAIQQIVDTTDSNYNYIANVGVSAGQLQFGGASFDGPILFYLNPDLPTAPYEEDNALPSHGFRDDSVYTISPNPPSIAAIDANGDVISLGQMSMWFAGRYRGNRAAAITWGAQHDQLSDAFIQKRTILENIGTSANPITIAKSFVTNIAVSHQGVHQMRTVDILSGYHRTSTLGKMWEYDPRTGVATRVYPYTTETLQVAAISLVNLPLTSAVVGHTITAPGGQVVTLAAGNIVLLQNQNNTNENGCIVIASSGGPAYMSSPPIQVAGTYWGTYTKTSASVWIFSRNYGSLPIIIANSTGTRAFGLYSPQIPLTGEGSNTTDGVGIGGYIRQQYQPSKDMNGWELQIKTPLYGTAYTMGPEPRLYKAFCCIGTLAQVEASLQACWNQWGKILRPSVFDWNYYAAQTFGLKHQSEDQIRLHYLCRGADQGLLGKASPSYGSFASKPSNVTNYNWVRDAA